VEETALESGRGGEAKRTHSRRGKQHDTVCGDQPALIRSPSRIVARIPIASSLAKMFTALRGRARAPANLTRAAVRPRAPNVTAQATIRRFSTPASTKPPPPDADLDAKRRLWSLGLTVAGVAAYAVYHYRQTSREHAEHEKHAPKKPALAAATIEATPVAVPAASLTVRDDDGREVAASQQQEQVMAYLREHGLNESFSEVLNRLAEEQDPDPYAFLAREFQKKAKHPEAPSIQQPVVVIAESKPAASTASTSSDVPSKRPAARHALQSIPASDKLPGHSESPEPEDKICADDDDSDEAFEAWKKEREKGFSASPSTVSPYSDRAHIRNIVADDIETVIDKREKDVLLQLYAPWCGACKMLAPVVDSVAEVLHDVGESEKRPMEVLIMDGEANEKPGFLTEEENRALPLIKFYPACGSLSSTTSSPSLRSRPECQPAVYQGRPNVQDLLEWLGERVKEEAKAVNEEGRKDSPLAKPLPLDRAHSLAQQLEPSTHLAVQRALQARFQADSDDMPALKLHEIAPCGAHLNELMKRFMLSSYTSYAPSPEVDEAAGAELFARYRECTEKEAGKLEEFWQQVKKQTDEALEGIEEKKRQREKGEKDGQAAAGKKDDAEVQPATEAKSSTEGATERTSEKAAASSSTDSKSSTASTSPAATGESTSKPTESTTEKKH
jgi:thiol-disulfide isomerase/thioredoxin